MKKLVSKQTQWSSVAKELKAEKIKLAYYDNTLIPLLRNLKEKKVLDYGAGPGILATALQKLSADVKVYDISEDMRKQAGKRIGKENVYDQVRKIPKNHFDYIICNLVLCIVPEREVKKIVKRIRNLLNDNGKTYIGFCNPIIFNVPESRIDFRTQTGHKYEENHRYKKIKKEGNYEIIEDHRPIKWYEKIYKNAGLKLIKKHFTPEYTFRGRKIKDFVIFELKK
jgi:2-polyprenyl-3-methyl-5-hydroxy-6-metoxy-1,4-benzoquinol methylase